MRVFSRSFGVLLLVCALAGPALAACSTGPAPTRDRVHAALVTAGLSRPQADCATNELFRVLTSGQLRNLAEHGSGALSDKASGALSTALGTCASASPSTAPPTSTATTSPQTAPQSSRP